MAAPPGDIPAEDVWPKWQWPPPVFTTVPEGGVTLPWGQHLDQEVADVSALPEAYRLYSSAFRMRWFKLGVFSSESGINLQKLVDRAIALSDEIIVWFECKKVGMHMWPSGLPKPMFGGKF